MKALNRPIAYLAALALCVPLAQSALRGWQLFRGELAPTGPAAAAEGPESAAGTEQARPAIERIAEWDLFGRAPPPAAAAPQVQAAAPKTRLQLSLHGVAASGESRDARAIIAEPSGVERHYRPGDAVPGGAEVAEIHPDRVILLRNGRYETLPLVRQDLKGGGADAGQLLPGGMRRLRTPPPVEMPPPPEPVPMPDEAAEPDPAEQ
jgi:general secretion pathway protein C